METTTDRRYPVGRFNAPTTFDHELREKCTAIIQQFPLRIRDAVSNLSAEQLDTPYRDGGWTVRQVVHHCADSHMNAYIRFRLALTEENPTIRPYLEALWAELPDAKHADIHISLNLIDALHKRWVLCIQNMQEGDFNRTYFHPEKQATQALSTVLALYSWHCEHHLHHILGLKERMGW